jgi:branched-subunit amino acid aminotransferase/4-amino-4-deoxychorismate lyase
MAAGILNYVSLNGAVMEGSQVRISPLGDGFMFGCGLFETVRVLQGRPVFLTQHLERLARSAEALGIPVPKLAGVQSRCDKLIAANQLSEGSLKIVVFRDVASTSELLVCRTLPYSDTDYTKGFRLMSRTEGRPQGSPAHKSTSYLRDLIAREQARVAGFDDLLFLDPSGDVLETSSANVFAVFGERVVTPPLRLGILPGIARAALLSAPGPGVVEDNLTREMLGQADEVFLTNALVGVMPVSAIDNVVYPFQNYRITPFLQEAFRSLQSGSRKR